MKKSGQKNLFRRFVDFVDENELIKSGDGVVVAVSGGPDSVCLFYLLLELAHERAIKLVIAHYNHSMRGREALRDEKFVKELAEKEGIPFICERAATGQINDEETARNFRYNFLEKARGERGDDWIAVGHNKNDLGETLLLNLIRGAGIRGIRSIPVKRDRIIRPLLFAERGEIEKFLQDRNITFCHDKSNDSPTFSRNFIRLEILPRLEKINPRILNSLERTAKLAQTYDDFVTSVATFEIKKISQKENKDIIIDRKKFISLSPVVQSEIIRILAENFGLKTDFSSVHIEEILGLIKNNVGKKHKLIAKRLKFAIQSGKIIVSDKRG
jgi:tRNA(Ile)-lysidine synthase